MARFGFCSGFYTSQSKLADCQTCMNLYPEQIESSEAKSQMALYRTPGLTVFATGASPVRGELWINGRLFWVGGGNLYEATAIVYAEQNGVQVPVSATASLLGAVGNDFNSVTMATNGTAGNQLVICSAGQVYCFYLMATGNNAAGSLIEVGGIQGQASKIVFCDGYFIVTIKNSNETQVSTLEDGSTWNPLSVEQVSVFPENIKSIVAVFRQLWLFGDAHAQVYYNSGANQYSPFDVIAGAYMEEGIDASDSLCVLDNAPFWIGRNANGAGIAFRANGYAPLRVSNFAIENAWSKYPKKSSDAVGYSYRQNGHTFWMLRFPSANNGQGATWCYDVATGFWHERGYLTNEGYSGYGAHRSTCHAEAFGLNLVGDWNSGNIYSMVVGTYSDNGNPIRWVRRAPHVSSENQRIFGAQLEISMQVGVGPEPPLVDGAGNPRDPQVCLRWSNDGGMTWSNEYWLGIGQAGASYARVIINRLGYSRDRVYEFSGADPVYIAIIDAYLRATPGFTTPTERYANQIGKMA